MTNAIFSRAPSAGALFVSALIFFGPVPWAQAASLECASDRYDRTGRTRVVYDGDTLELRDGTKVRLVGIDAPEMGRDERPPEAFAEAAYAHLLRLAGPGEQLNLRFDRQRRDRYGRLLAHVFRADGSNVQASLLARGLAATLVVPPNEWSHQCYALVEKSARAERRGVWSTARYRVVLAERLDPSARGFHIIKGVVTRIGESYGNLWLNLTPYVALRIPRGDLENFRRFDPRHLQGHPVEARGWLHRRKGQLRMTVRHPAALTLQK